MYDRAFSRRVNDHVHGVAALPMPTNHRIRLMTVNGTEVDYGDEAGSGGGYVSGSGAPVADFAASTDATPSLSALETAVVVANWPRAETLVGMELWADIAGTPTRLEFGAFDAPVVMAVGRNLILTVGAIASALGEE